MSKNDFETLRTAIEAIDAKQVQIPSIPVAIALQEAEDLSEWSALDIDLLVDAGLDIKYFKELPVRAGALRHTQNVWHREYKSLEEVQKEWAERAVSAYELRDNLLHYFLHAYRKHPDLLAKTKKIAEGSGHADMLLDLSNLGELGKKNPEPLVKTKMDLQMLDTALELSDYLSNLLAKANGARQSDNPAKILRDKAYTYMKEAVDEIRQHGQFVFYRNEARLKGYVSHYRKRKSASKAVNTTKV